MSLLETSNPDALAKLLEGMGPAALRRQADHVKSLLHHKAVIVRWAAAQALGRARLGAEELRVRLAKEPNPIVITEITESLAGLSDQQSLPGLRDLAERHPSPLVRSYALMAIADIMGKAVIPYLQEQRRKERSNYVKAALDSVLFAKGTDEALPDLFKDLKSRDVKVRRLVVNLLKHYAPRRKRPLVLAALHQALECETAPGARGDLEEAIEELS